MKTIKWFIFILIAAVFLTAILTIAHLANKANSYGYWMIIPGALTGILYVYSYYSFKKVFFKWFENHLK
jgi:O-antigen/teichoic acid export membrane protein